MRVRAILYALVSLYLVVDFFILRGPMWKAVRDLGWTQPTDTNVVATVNGIDLTQADLKVTLWRKLYQEGRLDRMNDKMLREVALHQMIDDQLVFRKAAWNPVEIPKEIEERQWQRWIAMWPSEKEKTDQLTAVGLDEEAWRGILREQLAVTLWIENQITPHLKVSADEIQSYFDANRMNFRVPDRMRVRHIFLSTVKRSERGPEIRRIYDELRTAPAKFSVLAKKYSEDSRSASNGGELPWLSRNDEPQDFCRAIFASPNSGLRAPFKSKLGWHIVEVLSHRSERQAELSEVRELVREKLAHDKRIAAVDALRSALRVESTIRIHR